MANFGKLAPQSKFCFQVDTFYINKNKHFLALESTNVSLNQATLQ